MTNLWKRATSLSLLWKILLATSIALTVLFAVTGWIIQNTAASTISASLEDEVQTSFRAYDSLWRSRADTLASVSLVLSRMSDVRAAFSTGDNATIRDTAKEIWSAVSQRDAIFLVTDPQGGVLASLGGSVDREIEQNLPVVKEAAATFPKQASGFMTAGGHLYQIVVTPVYVQTGGGLGLLNVLVAGYTVDGTVVQGLKESTGGSEFSFTSGESVVASTLRPQVESGLRHIAVTDGRPILAAAGGAEYMLLASPLRDVQGKAVGELRILRSFDGARQNIIALRINIVIVWLCAMLLGLGLTYSLARRILEPVKQLDQAAIEVARGNYDYRVATPPASIGNPDELGRLAQAFNAMAASIQQGRQDLIRQERIATIGRMSTSIVHDLRNPLAAIYGGAEMLMDEELSPAQVQRLAGNIYRSSRRMQELLQELVDTGRGKTISPETCRLKEVIEAACEVYASAAETQSVTVKIDVAEELELPLERARMERVFLNLIDNALGMMPNGGWLEIAAETNNGSVVVKVEDSGPGIPPEIRAHLFQPFVTSGKKNGVGLGLALSHRTVLDHGGELWADAAARSGARFFVKLPLQA